MRDQLKRKAIVYGGSGFLGSHVADALSDDGHDVKLFDKIPSPYLRDDQEMILGDLRDADQVIQAAQGCELLFNFAGIADIDEAHQDPSLTVQINVGGTVNTLQAAKEVKAKRYIFASTVYVYSNMGSMYKASKQAAECFIETFHEQYGVDYTVLRFGTLYGRRADRRNRIHSILQDALDTGTMEYPGSGEAVREFIHVRDAAQMTLRILGDDYANMHLILTGQEKMRIADLLRMISELMSNNVTWVCKDEEPSGHYMVTPYSFQPRLGHKLVPDDFIDLGQGLLDCLSELHEAKEHVSANIAVEKHSQR